MMSRSQAEVYGRRSGCKFRVVNDRGGLYGICRTMEQAEAMKARFEREIASNPFCRGEHITVSIESC